jgi:DNA-binding GntR family transcriptional regulator
MAQERIHNQKERLLPQRIFDMLEEAVLDRSLPPGTHLTEDMLATRLGVSRTPVREAVKMLAQAGWVEVHPHTGAHVRYPVAQEAREVFEVREALEQRAAELAAERATDEELSRLAEILEQGEKVALSSSDPKKFARLNSQFHGALGLAAHNNLFSGLLIDLEKKVRWHFQEVAGVRGPASWTEHREILDALKNHDPERAGGLIVSHIRATQVILLERLVSGESVHNRKNIFDKSAAGLTGEDGS